ncbi:MAG: hypothetical protein ACE5H9_04500 [Anaerolineae bacterium]
MNTVAPPRDLTPTATYRSRPSLLQVVETDRIRLIDEERGLSWSLRGIEATIWDLLAAGYPLQKILHFVSLWPDMVAGDAEGAVLSALESWHKRGLVEKTLDDQFNP